MVWSPRYPNKCVRYHAATRHAYEEISCVLAHSTDSKFNWWLSKTYHPWEFQVATYLQPPQWRTIIWTIVLSGLVMSVGKYLMLVRPAWRIRRMVACWNAVWMCVSFLGFIRLVPVVVHNWSHYPIHDNVCGHADTLWTSGTSGLWATLWVHLKLVEVMVETLLVVLLKQPCGMAEWFNNYAYILIHGNHLLTSQIPAGSAVIMTYYGVSSMVNLYCWYLNTHPSQLQPRKSKIVFDVAQLVQTFAGVALSVTTLHYWKHAIWNHRHCHAKEEHLRIVAFSWTGGHVLIAALSAVNQQWVQTQAAADAALRKQKRRLRAKAEAAEARLKKNGKRTTKLPPTKTVTFANETEIIIKGKTTKKQPTTATAATTTSTTRPILVVPAKKKRISTSASSSANALLKQHLVKHRKKILAATSKANNGSNITTIPEESESVKDDDEEPIEDDKSYPIEEAEEADKSSDSPTKEPDTKNATLQADDDNDDFADAMEDALDPLAMPSTDSLPPPKPKETQADNTTTATAAAAVVVAEEPCATTNGSQSNSSSTINSSTSNNNGMEGVRRRKKKKKKKKKKRNSNTSLGSVVDNLDYNSSTTSISATNNNNGSNSNNHNNNDESTSTFDPLFDDPFHGINNNSNHDKDDDDDSHWELTVAQRKKQRKRQKKQQQKFQNQQKSDHDQHLKDD